MARAVLALAVLGAWMVLSAQAKFEEAPGQAKKVQGEFIVMLDANTPASDVPGKAKDLVNKHNVKKANDADWDVIRGFAIRQVFL